MLQIKRHLETRLKEYQNDFRSTTVTISVVSKHIILFEHNFDWLKPVIS